jgi:hypothetical protein
VVVDYSFSEYGHLIVKNGNDEIRLMIKGLSDLDAIPFSKEENENIDNFEFVLLTVGIYNKEKEYFQIPVLEETKKLITHNTGKNGKEKFWINPNMYQQFKVSEFDVNQINSKSKIMKR